MKKPLPVFLPVVVLAAFLFAACEQPAGGGGGAPQITISDAAGLAKIGVDPGCPLNGAYTLGADIVLQNRTPIGTYDAPFTGTFNGDNHTVTVTGEGGIFGFTRGARIRNVKAAGTITKTGRAGAAVYAGGITGYAENTEIASCVSSVNITLYGDGHNSSAGGIAGYMLKNCVISDCSVSGTITLESGLESGLMVYAGGIAGYGGTGLAGAGASDCVILRCSYTGSVSVRGGYPYAGGITGYNYYGSKIAECYSSGTVSAAGGNLPYAGGIAGYNSGYVEDTGIASLIENCYTVMTVKAESSSRYALAGGISGANANDALISRCYARGDVSVRVNGDSDAGTGESLGVPGAGSAGGIAGAQYFKSPVIENCAALNGKLSGEDSGSGAVWNFQRIAGAGGGGQNEGQWKTNIAFSGMTGDGAGSFGGDKGPGGKDGDDCAATPAQADYTALGWDFDEVWKMAAGGYPALQWED